MISRPKALPVRASVAEVRRILADDHVVMALLTEDGVLRGTLLREDLPDAAPDTAPALPWSRLTGRTVAPITPLAEVHVHLLWSGRRRLAVVNESGRLLGLVCLKRRRSGYCSDAGVEKRARTRGCAPALRGRADGRTDVDSQQDCQDDERRRVDCLPRGSSPHHGHRRRRATPQTTTDSTQDADQADHGDDRLHHRPALDGLARPSSRSTP